MFISPRRLIYAPMNKWFMLVSVGCCSHYTFAASLLSGFQKEPWSDLANLTSWSVTQSTPLYCHFYLAKRGCVFLCVVFVWTCGTSTPPPPPFPSGLKCITLYSQRLLSLSRSSLGGLFNLQTCMCSWQALSVWISARHKLEHTEQLCRAEGLAQRHTHARAQVLRSGDCQACTCNHTTKEMIFPLLVVRQNS